MQRIISGVVVECVKGNIAEQLDIDVVVNAANAQLLRGSGVAGAIHRAAGPGLEEECRALGPIKPGAAVITDAHDLPNEHIIHCLGPVYGRDKPEDELLANCYRNSLNIAEMRKVSSIAYPAISTGAFGYPIEEATKVVFKTILEIMPTLSFVKKIRFVLYSDKDLEVHEKALTEFLS